MFVARDVIFNDIEDDKVRKYIEKPKIIEANKTESPRMSHPKVEPQHEEQMNMTDEDLVDIAISTWKMSQGSNEQKLLKKNQICWNHLLLVYVLGQR